jgi:hypothetical protein
MVRPALLESLNPVHQDLRVVTDSIVVGRHTKACQVNVAPSCHPAPYMTMMLWPRGEMSRVGSFQALQTACSRSQSVVWCADRCMDAHWRGTAWLPLHSR